MPPGVITTTLESAIKLSSLPENFLKFFTISRYLFGCCSLGKTMFRPMLSDLCLVSPAA